MEETGIIYIRVSTTTQEEKGVSLDMQKNHGVEFFKSIGITDVKIIKDNTSGINLDRGGIEGKDGLFEWIKKKNVNKVWAYTRDRLSRDPKHMGVIEYFFKQNDITLYTEDMVINEEEFVTDIRDVVAKKENTDRIKRILDSKIEGHNQGIPMFKVPFGYKRERKGEVEQTPDILFVKKVFALRKLGWGWLKICKEMKFYTKGGFPQFRKVEWWIGNPFYAGYLLYKGHFVKGKHYDLRIIELEEFLVLNKCRSVDEFIERYYGTEE